MAASLNVKCVVIMFLALPEIFNSLSSPSSLENILKVDRDEIGGLFHHCSTNTIYDADDPIGQYEEHICSLMEVEKHYLNKRQLLQKYGQIFERIEQKNMGAALEAVCEASVSKYCRNRVKRDLWRSRSLRGNGTESVGRREMLAGVPFSLIKELLDFKNISSVTLVFNRDKLKDGVLKEMTEINAII